MVKYYDEEPVVGSWGKYHRQTCHIVKNIDPSNYKLLRSWKEAVDKYGLEPCQVCKPYGFDWSERKSVDTGAPIGVSTATLSEWRRRVVRLLGLIDPMARPKDTGAGIESIAGKIARLSRSGKIPREISPLLRTITEMRNVAEYGNRELTRAQGKAARAAWEAILEWASENDLAI